MKLPERGEKKPSLIDQPASRPVAGRIGIGPPSGSGPGTPVPAGAAPPKAVKYVWLGLDLVGPSGGKKIRPSHRPA